MKELIRALPLLIACLLTAGLIIWTLNGSASDRGNCNRYVDNCSATKE